MPPDPGADATGRLRDLRRGPTDVPGRSLTALSDDHHPLVLHVQEATPWLLQLELQSGYNRELGERVLEYSVLLRRRHHLPVRSIVQLLQGVQEMEESVTYQAIVRKGRVEGRVEEARALLLRLGQKRFGPPSPETQAALEAITDIGRLELLSERLLDVESWEELLAG